MSKETENPPAFPSENKSCPHCHIGKVTEKGMTLSDYFEAKAMQALITSNFIKNADGFADVRYDYDDLASEAELYADAMLKKRNK